jgi:4-amino-4-deoxy-L-arabinose transferase-like glycosyltransferase
VTRRELVVVGACVAAGLALRAFRLDAAGTDHFDEGVYLMTALGLSDPAAPWSLYEGQRWFSPPLHFGLLAAVFALVGPSDVAAAAVSVVAGGAGILALHALARGAFGPAAGVAAAALLALDESHVALSRSALTDATFGTVFLVALALVARALARPGPRAALLAGLATGAAWNVKYHGWLAVGIGGAALAARAVARRALPPARSLAALAGAGALAALAYLPWALWAHGQPGGYAALAAYQRGFLSLAWASQALEQLRLQAYLDGPASHAAPFAALAAAAVLRPGARIPRAFAVALAGAAAASLALGSFPVVAIAAVAGWVRVVARRPAAAEPWVAAAFLAVFAALTFFYHPYARLLLPLQLAAFALAGAALAELPAPRGLPAAPFAAALAAVVALAAAALPDPSNPWRPADSMRRAAAQIAARLPPGARVLVIGEPSVQFYLETAGCRAFERVEDMEALAAEREPVFVVTGVYARRAPALRDGLAGLAPRLERLGVFPVVPKDLRVLDDHSAREARAFRARPDATYDLTLWRLRPAPGA